MNTGKSEKSRQVNQAARLDELIRQEAGSLPSQVYEQLTTEAEASTLKNGNVFLTSSVLGMTAISRVIEDQALNMGEGVRFYACFQRFSRVKPQEERYRRLLTAQIPLYLFGLPDAPLWDDPYLHLIGLTQPIQPSEPSLVNNWFVVLYNPQFVSMALVSRELLGRERSLYSSDQLVYRNFEGFWTYDKDVVKRVVTILDDFIQDYQAANAASPN